ncbi:hypothetical protein FRB90_007386 [Tulasnella sp. 427]|nr:hypothetical protein FRB90_007386 [Tulasnella sp. 427]
MSSENDASAIFVSPVGGFPTKVDFTASITFAGAYGLALTAFLWRLIGVRSRIVLPVLCTFLVVVERVVLFSLRANASAHLSSSASEDFLLFYQQVSFAISWALLGMDLSSLLRALLVNTTLADERRGSFDQADRRKQYRRLSRVYISVFGGVAAIGLVVGVLHGTRVLPTVVIIFRYANAIFGALALGAFMIHIQRLRDRVMYLPGSAADLLTVLAGLLLVTPLFRCTILHNRTPLAAPNVPDITNPSSLSSPISKACFYVFHIAPEFLVVVTLSVLDIRKAFNTGIHGDWRWSDKSGLPRLRHEGTRISGVGVDKRRHSRRMTIDDDDEERAIHAGLLVPPNPQMQHWTLLQ